MSLKYFPNKGVVGEINLLGLLDEYNIDTKKNIPMFPKSFTGKCTIEVYEDEGSYIPHFHIDSVNGDFSCCICLFDNRFFEHGTHKDKLNKRDWQVLDDWMRMSNGRNPNTTNWNYAISLWNNLNGIAYMNNNDKLDCHNQPNYTIIKSYKEK